VDQLDQHVDSFGRFSGNCKKSDIKFCGNECVLQNIGDFDLAVKVVNCNRIRKKNVKKVQSLSEGLHPVFEACQHIFTEPQS